MFVILKEKDFVGLLFSSGPALFKGMQTANVPKSCSSQASPQFGSSYTHDEPNTSTAWSDCRMHARLTLFRKQPLKNRSSCPLHGYPDQTRAFRKFLLKYGVSCSSQRQSYRTVFTVWWPHKVFESRAWAATSLWDTAPEPAFQRSVRRLELLT